MSTGPRRAVRLVLRYAWAAFTALYFFGGLAYAILRH